MELPMPSKKQIKKDAKKAKDFMILIKKKLQRGQVCRGNQFRRLMAIVFDPEEKD